MKEFSARQILQLSETELWALEGPMTIVFDDDDRLETTGRHTILSWYYWEAIRRYPDVPIVKTMHAGSIAFNGSNMLKTLGVVIFGIYGQYQFNGQPIDRVALARLTFEIINRIYNVFSINLSSYATTFSAFDLIEIMDDPIVKQANESISDSKLSIDRAYEVIGNRLKEPGAFKGNAVALAVKVGTAPLGQVLQCVSAVGFRTDINAEIFPKPVTKGFFEGIRDLYSAMIESRSGAKAALYNKDLISKTETLNRELQLVAQTLQRLHPGDCGTKYTLDFHVNEDYLKILEGKHYYLEDPTKVSNPQLYTFTGKEKHLIGKHVYVRAIAGCMHSDPEGVCETCYGTIANSVMPGTNIGHLSATIFGARITQLTLSTKHLDASAKIDPMVLGPVERKFLVRKENDVIYFRKEMDNRPMWLTLELGAVPGITDTETVADIETLVPERVSKIERAMLEVPCEDETDAIEHHMLNISMYNRYAFLTMDALMFIRRQLKAHKCEYTYTGPTPRIRIDMTGYPTNRPVFALPYTHVNMVEYMQDTKSFLYSSSKTRTGIPMPVKAKRKMIKPKVLADFHNIRDGVLAFINRTNYRLRANFVHMEVLAYVFSAKDPMSKNYSLPKPGLSGRYVRQSELVMGRSLSILMAYSNQAGGIFSIDSFMIPERNNSPFDACLESGVTDN